MLESKKDIIARLQREILPLQGLKHMPGSDDLQFDLGPISTAFPNGVFPLGAMHEFISKTPEDSAATNGFIAALTGWLMRSNGAVLWVGSSRRLFPPALKFFGITPDQIVFIEERKEKNILWAIEEALKCEGLAAVIGEIPEINFTASRRLQLAVEQSRVTGFIHRQNPRTLHANACVSRWFVTPLPSMINDVSGVGFPCWHIELAKIRNGKPAAWQMKWVDNKLQTIFSNATVIGQEKKRKTG
ncbi:MAG: Error-prone repair protein ImuA [Bacteroidetes bacterium]|nr:Error-prone repair protein ImuA [Bacteroidota bacterium]